MIEAWGWAQWVWVGLMLISLLFGAHYHGRPRGPYNFWVVLLGNLLGLGLLYAGGFWG